MGRLQRAKFAALKVGRAAVSVAFRSLSLPSTATAHPSLITSLSLLCCPTQVRFNGEQCIRSRGVGASQ